MLLLFIYCALILLASLAGGWIPLVLRLTHTRLQIATSFVAGLMLGVGLLILLPHAWLELRSIDRAAQWLAAGFLTMFFIQRFFHFHHHDVSSTDASGAGPHAQEAHGHHEHEHRHAHGGAACAGHDEDLALADRSALKLTWAGAAFGLTLHTLIDGFALAASMQADVHSDEGAWMLGFTTFLVIILHKPFDAMAISTLMAASGWSKLSRHWVNALFALAIPVGVLLFYMGAGLVSAEGEAFLGGALAFAAGTFLCIAASDLLPELQFHSHDRVKLSVALLLGLLLAVLVGLFEQSGHAHGDEGVSPEPQDSERSHGHGHGVR